MILLPFDPNLPPSVLKTSNFIHADLHHRRSSTSTDLLPGCIFAPFDNNQWLSLRGGLAQYGPWDLEATYGDFRWRNLSHEFRTASWMQIFWEGSTQKTNGESAVFVVRWSLDGKVIMFHKFRKKRRGLSQGVMRSWAKRKVLVDLFLCLFFLGGVYYSINSPRLLRTARCLGVESFVAGPKYMQTRVRLTFAYTFQSNQSICKLEFEQFWNFWTPSFGPRLFSINFVEIPKKCQRLWSHHWGSDLQCQPAFPGRYGCDLVCLQWPPGCRLRGPGLLQPRAPRAPHDDEPGNHVAAAVPGTSGADAVCSGRVLHQSPGGGRGSFGGGMLEEKAWQKLHAYICNTIWGGRILWIIMYLTIRL